jgi:hypothetical protein
MIQRAVHFGSHRGLVGVYSEPEGLQRRAEAPVVLTANVGVHHRVGPLRLYVDLAMRLSALGIPSFRFDLSGLGDSEPRADVTSELERARLDFREAMAEMSARGHQRFVLIGFCSGVDPVHAVARDDPRVVGAAFIDGYAYETPGYFLHRLQRLAHRSVWEDSIRRRINKAMGITEEDDGDLYTREHPTRAQCAADLDTMLAKGTQLLFVFTAGAQGFNHASQLFEMFPRLRGSGTGVEYHDRADHLFSAVEDRSRVVDSLTRWVATHF